LVRPKLLDARKVALARVMHAENQVAINDICTTLGIGRTTLYRYLNAPPGRGLNHTEVRT
jgi:helix-turn-helix resolvase-like protein